MSPSMKDADSLGRFHTVLLRISVPENMRAHVRNDLMITKALNDASKAVYIYVTGPREHKTLTYISELYSSVWDLAVSSGKAYIDTRILGNLNQFSSWYTLGLDANIGIIYGEEETFDLTEINSERCSINGIEPLMYQSLCPLTLKYVRPEFHYFEDDEADLSPHDTVWAVPSRSAIFHPTDSALFVFGQVMIGGTFDHLHNGHKKLLGLAVSICKNHLVVGVTAAHMLKHKKYPQVVESEEKRRAGVMNFIAFLNSSITVEVVMIDDAFGPTITFPGKAALVVSTETVDAVSEISAIRSSLGFLPLHIFVCQRTETSTMSSTFIREIIAKDQL